MCRIALGASRSDRTSRPSELVDELVAGRSQLARQPVSPADAILDAFASQRLIEPLSDNDHALDEDRAYAIASEIHARRVA